MRRSQKLTFGKRTQRDGRIQEDDQSCPAHALANQCQDQIVDRLELQQVDVSLLPSKPGGHYFPMQPQGYKASC